MEPPFNKLKHFFESIEVEPPCTLEERLHALSSVAPHAVFIEGEEGTGKTTLLLSFKDYLRQQNVGVIQLSCIESTVSPCILARNLIKKAEVLYSDKAANLHREYSDVLANLSHRLEVRDAESMSHDRAERFVVADLWLRELIGMTREIITYLLKLVNSGSKPMVILLDDFHLADSWAVSFMAYLVRRIKHQPLFICVACDSEVKLESSLIRNFLNKSDHYQLKLEPMDSEQAALRSAISVDGKSSAQLPEVKHPLFLRELSLYLNEHDLNARTRGEADLPRNCTEAIQARLKLLQPDQRRVLDYLSLFDDPLNGKQLDFLIHTDDDSFRLDKVLTELRIRKIVIEQQGKDKPEYRVSHPLWKRIVMKNIAITRKHTFHLRIAELLERELRCCTLSEWDASDKIDNMYHHFRKGGDWLKVVQYNELYYSCKLNNIAENVVVDLEQLDHLIATASDLGKAIKSRVNLGLAKMYQKKAQTEKCIRAYQKCLDLEEDVYLRSHIYVDLASVYIHHGEERSYEKAIRFINMARKEAKHITDSSDLQKHVLSYVNNAEAFFAYRRKNFRYAIKLEKEALGFLDQMCDSDNGKLKQAAKETILLNMATVYRKLRHEITDVDYYTEIVGLRSETMWRALNLKAFGDALYEAQRYDEALKRYLECAELSSSHYRHVNTCMAANQCSGLCCHNLRDYLSAVKHFRNALELAIDIAELSEIATLLTNLGLSCYKVGDYKRAFFYYFEAFKIRKKTKTREIIRSCVDLAIVSLRENDYKKAIKCFIEAGSRASKFEDFDGALKYLLAALNCYRQAGISDVKLVRDIANVIPTADPREGGKLQEEIRQWCSSHMQAVHEKVSKPESLESYLKAVPG